jgi:CTP:phosphocholine cytidylyltransferase-like protein
MKGVIKGAFEVLKFKVEVIIIYDPQKNEKNETIFFIDAARL